MREAVRLCRFVTPNMARNRAWAWTGSEEIAGLLGGAARYRRSAEPEIYEYEITITHPDGVAFICDLVDARHA
jgi:hypothetical protein